MTAPTVNSAPKIRRRKGRSRMPGALNPPAEKHPEKTRAQRKRCHLQRLRCSGRSTTPGKVVLGQRLSLTQARFQTFSRPAPAVPSRAGLESHLVQSLSPGEQRWPCWHASREERLLRSLKVEPRSLVPDPKPPAPPFPRAGLTWPPSKAPQTGRPLSRWLPLSFLPRL